MRSEFGRLSWTKYNFIYFDDSRNISILCIKSLELVHQGNTSDMYMYNLIYWILYFCILLIYTKIIFLPCYQCEKILKKSKKGSLAILRISFKKPFLKYIIIRLPVYILNVELFLFCA